MKSTNTITFNNYTDNAYRNYLYLIKSYQKHVVTSCKLNEKDWLNTYKQAIETGKFKNRIVKRLYDISDFDKTALLVLIDNHKELLLDYVRNNRCSYEDYNELFRIARKNEEQATSSEENRDEKNSSQTDSNIEICDDKNTPCNNLCNESSLADKTAQDNIDEQNIDIEIPKRVPSPFKPDFTEKQLSDIVNYANTINLFTELITIEDFKAIIFLTDTSRKFTSTNNQNLAAFFDALAINKHLSTNWQSIAGKHKLFIGPKGAIITSSNLSSSKYALSQNDEIEQSIKSILRG